MGHEASLPVGVIFRICFIATKQELANQMLKKREACDREKALPEKRRFDLVANRF